MDAPSGSEASPALVGALFRAPEIAISYRRNRPWDRVGRPGERHLWVREHAPFARIRAPTAADKPAPTRRRRAAAQKRPPRCPKALAQPSLPVSPGSTAPATTALYNDHGLGLGPARRLPPGHDLARGHPQPARVPVDADETAKTPADAADQARVHGRHRPPRPAARVSGFHSTSRPLDIARLRRETRQILRRPHRKVLTHRAAKRRSSGRRRQGSETPLPEGPTAPEVVAIRQGTAHVQGAISAF